MVKPFVPDKYLCKINVVELEHLPQYIDPSNLLPDYGGTLSFDQSAFIDMLVSQQNQAQQPQYQYLSQQQQPTTTEKLQQQQEQQFTVVGTGGL